jgi:penicillin-binding protein-related factor A (putative recombinase)
VLGSYLQKNCKAVIVMANIFETEIAKSFRVADTQSYLSDISLEASTSLLQDLKCPYLYTKLVVNKQMSYGVETPCDALVERYKKIGLALELKEQLHREAFKFSRVPDHQIKGLKEFKLFGRNSYILLCFRHWKLLSKDLVGLKPIEQKNLQKRRAYCLEIDTFLQLKEKAIEQSKSSIPIDWIVAEGIRMTDTYSTYLTKNNTKAKAATWDISVIP